MIYSTARLRIDVGSGSTSACRSLSNDVSRCFRCTPRIADQVNAQVKVVGLVPIFDSCTAARCVYHLTVTLSCEPILRAPRLAISVPVGR